MENKAIKNQQSKTTNQNYLPWLILREIPYLGNVKCKALIDHFHSPEAVLNASESILRTEAKYLASPISERIIKNILKYKTFEDNAKKELDFIFKHNIRLLTLTDEYYPPLLKEIPDPPPILSYYGTLDLESPCLAIVGSRKATTYGLNAADNMAFRLASSGFQIVSGLARGIDSMAHKGALRANGKTIAVLGSGLKQIYPRENAKLYQAIAETGCVISEFKTFCSPMAANFPIRNRIIAGLSCGTIVVEAAKKSGSLITARLTGEYNREIFAVPGSIQSRTSEGTHALLKQGAKLVATEKDILDELQQFIHIDTSKKTDKTVDKSPGNNYQGDTHQDRTQKSKLHKHTKNQNGILKFLEPYPIHIDTLIEKSGMESSQLSAELFDLELERRIVRHPGNYYSIEEL